MDNAEPQITGSEPADVGTTAQPVEEENIAHTAPLHRIEQSIAEGEPQDVPTEKQTSQPTVGQSEIHQRGEAIVQSTGAPDDHIARTDDASASEHGDTFVPQTGNLHYNTTQDGNVQTRDENPPLENSQREGAQSTKENLQPALGQTDISHRIPSRDEATQLENNVPESNTTANPQNGRKRRQTDSAAQSGLRKRKKTPPQQTSPTQTEDPFTKAENWDLEARTLHEPIHDTAGPDTTLNRTLGLIIDIRPADCIDRFSTLLTWIARRKAAECARTLAEGSIPRYIRGLCGTKETIKRHEYWELAKADYEIYLQVESCCIRYNFVSRGSTRLTGKQAQ